MAVQVRGVIAIMSAGRLGHETNVTSADTPLANTPLANGTIRNGTECVHDVVSGGGEAVGCSWDLQHRVHRYPVFFPAGCM